MLAGEKTSSPGRLQTTLEVKKKKVGESTMSCQREVAQREAEQREQ